VMKRPACAVRFRKSKKTPEFVRGYFSESGKLIHVVQRDFGDPGRALTVGY
jgi:hypothetical protein